MDNSTIALKPVKDLLGMNFFIPDYQRGYRWTAQQLKDLLDDIWDFEKKEKTHAEIYCIQPLVVQKNSTGILEKIKTEATTLADVEALLKSSWNVVDGQQRLTTIFLILSAIGCEKAYSLEYQTRSESAQYLKNINEEDANKYIDFHHIYQVHKEIEAWFRDKTLEQIQQFKMTLLEKVHFIWYEIAEGDTEGAIAAFKRLNIGKIPLTDSELVKALFLNRSNFSCASADLESKQRKMAMEWDQIEYTLQDDSFWLFLQDNNYDKPTRIDFILDMICESGVGAKAKKEKDLLNAAIGYDEHRTFRYFYHVFRRGKANEEILDQQWEIVRDYFRIFNEWFHDYKLYHYVGYLSVVKKDTSLISNLVAQWNAGSKDDFLKYLHQQIKTKLQENKDGFEDLDNFCYDEENKKGKVAKTNCVPILLLHNIETIIWQNKKLVADERYGLPKFTKFPFHLYKREQWQVEHIRPNAGDRLNNETAKKNYTLLAKKYLPDQDDLHAKIDAFLNDDGDVSFDSLSLDIQTADQALSDSDKNKLWNYTLLDAQTNKEYGNMIFPIKRVFLIKKEQGYKIKVLPDGTIDDKEQKDEVAFVPPCTKNVFTKFYTDTPTGLLEWTRPDAEAYLQDIKEKLEVYRDKEDNS